VRRSGHSRGYGYSPYYYRPHYYGWGWYPYYGYYDGFYYGYYGWPSPFYSRTYYFRGAAGSIRLLVDPEDAEVYVDGYYAGEVDDFNGLFQRLRVRPGRHEITLKLAGYRTHRIKVYVPVDRTLRIHHHMERGESADATEDVIGSPEMEEASQAPVEREEEESVVEEPATGEPEAEEPEASEPEAAALTTEVHIAVEPGDAAIYVDGEFLGTGNDVEGFDLPAGKHRLEVVRPGHATFVKELDIAKQGKQELELKIVLKKTVSS